MRCVRFALPGVILAFAAFIAAGSNQGQAPASSIQLYMPNGGMPSRAIRLTLVTDRGETDTVFTDSKGVFLMRTPTASSINYTVTIDTDRQTFDTTVSSFRLDRNSPARIPIFLRPLSGEKRVVGASAVLDAANFEGNIPAKAKAAYKRGMDSINSGKLEDAIPELQQAISIYPEYVRARNDLGVTFMKLRRLDEAAAAFRKAIEYDKRFFHSRMNLGIVLNKQGKYKEALEILEPLYGENRGMLELRLAYGQALGGAGEYAEAEKLYRATLESKNVPDTTQANLHFRLGVLLNREGRFNDAVGELEKAIALDPDGANSHVQLGAALMQLHKPEQAEHELLRGYELAGERVGIAQLLLGQIYYAQQKFGEAQRAFEQYLHDMPSAPNADQITHLVTELKAKSRK
jgi:Flp pilus assembly protein TadD